MASSLDPQNTMAEQPPMAVDSEDATMEQDEIFDRQGELGKLIVAVRNHYKKG